MAAGEPPYLYLTTTGRRTGRPREIEIWFTRHAGRHYVIAEHGERAQWVLNLIAEPRVRVRLGRRSFAARARMVRRDTEPDLARAVRQLSKQKYGWGDGLVVELRAVPGGSGRGPGGSAASAIPDAGRHDATAATRARRPPAAPRAARARPSRRVRPDAR
jgi:deazaflavin-dependent oxidoreductase (nitroreductase family)